MFIGDKIKAFARFIYNIGLIVLDLPDKYQFRAVDENDRLNRQKLDEAQDAVLAQTRQLCSPVQRIYLEAWDGELKKWVPAVIVISEKNKTINRNLSTRWLFGEGKKLDYVGIASVIIGFTILLPLPVLINIAYSFIESKWGMSRQSRALLSSIKDSVALSPTTKRLLTVALNNEWRFKRR